MFWLASVSPHLRDNLLCKLLHLLLGSLLWKTNLEGVYASLSVEFYGIQYLLGSAR